MDYITKKRARSKSILNAIFDAEKSMNIDRVLKAIAALKAREDVTPCIGRKWRECVTIEIKAALWYNDSKGSTHICDIDPKLAAIILEKK